MSEHSVFDPGFPVLLYQNGMELPNEGTYYLVAGNGLWLHKDTGIVQAFVPVQQISVLDDLNANAWAQCKLPRLPAQCVFQIKQFFQKVVEIYHAEAIVTLYYNKATSQYKLHVPRQNVSGVGVRYRRTAMTHLEDVKDYLPVGTIHSHCDFGAFHSGTDIHDEEDFDGIHCTFGHNDKEQFTITACVVVNGHRCAVNPMDWLDGIEAVTEKSYRLLPPDQQWVESSPIEVWLKRVNPPARSYVIEKGDMVAWAGSMSVVPFRATCGEGPFKVDSVDGDHITVETNIGLSRFSSRLFRKVDDETNT